ncbi:LPS export ABC transporter permease LptG [Pelomonas sp. CA6]|uniref:LPS export ABC transporter permease LptG n=1 Tax=Pelomonas sp. CA6 TaxID=2907999 RepID=UPI001F4BF68A|nr:LPS export ABC transporter permease LptG [Pelomonas sp. CA6]MCH7344135.1 LPS export ABC transporter permease LptG [Pelomonas sp. CA6]
MRTVRRLLYREILGSVTLVMLGFLALFFFLDFIDDLERFTRSGAGAGAAALMTALKLPGHFYELLPIAVLIGSIFSLARLAQSSEYTILRTGGLGPGRALGLLSSLALGFGVLAFVVGDYVAPWTDRMALDVKARATGGVTADAGAWLKDRVGTPDGEFSYAVRVGKAKASGVLEDVLIYEFDERGAMLTRTTAQRARVDAGGRWALEGVQLTEWTAQHTPMSAALQTAGQAPQPMADGSLPLVRQHQLPQHVWQSRLGAGVVSAALLPAWNMSTLELYRYTRHLSSQEQSAQQHEIEFWRKALYPFACMVMLSLALPFAYLHFRSGGISYKVFGGIMLGISFVLLNNLAGHLGILRGWTPWAVAAAPSLLYLGLAMGAFTWLVRYR